MNNIDDDAQLRLERQALTNVRALLDKVEAGERHPSVLGVLIVVIAVAVVAVLILYLSAPGPSTEIAATRSATSKPSQVETPAPTR